MDNNKSTEQLKINQNDFQLKVLECEVLVCEVNISATSDKPNNPINYSTKCLVINQRSDFKNQNLICNTCYSRTVSLDDVKGRKMIV